MARPSARLTDLASPPGEDGMAARSRDPAPASALAPSIAAPAPPAPPAPSQARSAQRRARNASVASVNPESSNLGSLDFAQLQMESDSSDSDFRPARRPAPGPGHSRSMSNPFPSFFSPKKNRAQGGSSSGFGDSGSSDEGEPLPTRQRNGRQSGNTHLAPVSAAHGRKPSFSTGSCITCGSLMRWARGVEAFRCGICMTVNDLVPAGKTGAGSHDPPSKPQPSAAGPISAQQTGILIEKCLRSYLEAILSDVDVASREVSHLDQTVRPGPAPVVTYDGQAVGRLSEEPAAASTFAARTTASRRPGQPHVRGATSSTSQPITQPAGGQSRRPINGRLPQHSRAPSSGQPPHSRSLSSSRFYDHSQPSNTATTASSTGPSTAPQTTSSSSKPTAAPMAEKQEEKDPGRRIFRPLEDYIVSHFLSMDCLDSSFVPAHQPATSRNARDLPSRKLVSRPLNESPPVSTGPSAPELDAKLLLARGISENGSWWSSVQGRVRPTRSSQHSQAGEGKSTATAGASRPIYVDWLAVDEWYGAVLNAGATWESVYDRLVDEGKCKRQPSFLLEQIEAQILKGQEHAQRVLLKAIETVLKRPGRRIGESGDFRFLIITLANPLLQASCKLFAGNFQHGGDARPQQPRPKPEAGRGTGPASGQHSVIIKRVLGLMSNSSDEWHSQMIACFARFSEARFLQTKDLVGGFLAYRLVRYNEKKEETKRPEIADPLVPKVPEGASAASFHAALNQASGSTKKPKQPSEKKMTHGDDWQIKAAARVLGLLFAANNSAIAHRSGSEASAAYAGSNGTSSRARLRGQILPTSDFYITLLDNCDLVADFEGWEQQTAKFAFCQYPFLLSVWAKIQILEYEARRQMKNKARDAFFDSIMTRRNFDQHLILNVRRDCLVEDSLKSVSAAIGSGTDDIKKGLRIIFNGEEGIDAGGLRKEWFLLLVREVFNPDHGMFTYDEESQYCYFNPASFETSDQFFLVGVVLGLAIYNSTILDVALPPFAFRKLLLAAPPPAAGLGTSMPRPAMTYTLADLAEYRPRLARGLQQLLDYDGDVESTFCLEFTIAVERYGHTDTVPLCPGGETRAVTNSNREEYVGLYVRYLLDTAVFRQFEPFKRGFFTVCGCNALGLFRPEEIELLVRGSDEPLDVASLRLAASYENWPSANPLESEPTIQWFWESFKEASAKDQRKLLIFITGSDRIPATGPASLSIRILCLGKDAGRYPTARTCFNTLTLYRYNSKEKLQARLWGAVNESEGFGLK